MVEIFHILLGAMIVIGGSAAYLHVAQEPDEDQPLPSRHAPRLSLVATGNSPQTDDRRASPAAARAS